jgi:tetratricopeptide (TPR) repeat protein
MNVLVYLDEVQDFSYAKLYLICSVAGRLKRQWIAAGDTAQMISSGCSFTFSGMKEVLRAIQGGDVTLGKVQRLKRNYRLTKSVLDVGNAIVRVLKEKFPGVIEYSQPEVAMKDLGLDVILIDWKEGFGQKVKFGTQQALIYSTGTGQIKKSGTQEEDRDLKTKIDAFLPDHPFTLSSLESKGLEFQDVVVVFDFSHGAWNITDRKANPQESIKLLRELYVAVTRARGRLVIFVRNREKFPYMYSFFRDLECGINTDVFANVDTLRLEFDNETTGHMWFQKGKEMFEEEQFRLAASCFKSAESYGWMNRAFGKFFLLSRGRNSDAKDAFRKSAKQFYEDEEYERCLDVYRDILDLPPWDERDNELLDSSLEKRPHYLSRRWMLQLAIKRNAWHVIQRGDLVDPSTSDLFKLYQMHEHIEEILSASSDEELADIANVLPIAVASHYLEKHRYREAVDLYLQNGSQDDVRRTVDAMDTDDREKQATIRVVAKHYHRMDDMERCLDHLKRLYDLPLPWDTEDNAMVHNALVQCPSYLGRVDQTKLCLASDFWDMIESTDLQPALKPLFAKYRERPEMEVLILSCSKKELARIAGVLPNIVGDYYFNKSSYTEARKLYTRGKDKTRAAEADKKLKEAKKKQVPTPKPKQVRVPPTSVPRSPPAVASTAGIDSSSSSDGSDMRDLSSAFAIDSSSSGDMPKVLPKSHTTGKKSKRRSARKPAPKAPPPVDGAFPVGTRVRLKSLKTAQHLNHKTGIVATPLNEDRRQGITMDAPSLGVKAVKPENLELMAAEDNDSSNEDDSDLPTLVPRMGHYNSNSSGSDSEPPDLLGPGGDDSSSDDYDDMPPLQMRGRNDSSSDDDRPRSRRGH